jgi:DNA-binding Lrp family transcriptional regulator
VLAAFKVPPARLDEVARLLNAHPGVTHNYARGGEYNLWFTVTAPGDRDLSREVAEMARAAGVNDPLFLPAVKIFKIGFRLTMGRGAGRPARERVAPVKGHLPGVIDKPFVRALQKELPLCLRPYRPAARRLGLTEGQVTALLQRSMQTGAIRRVAAVLGPVQAGYPVNILTVWEAPPGKTADVGRAAAGCKQVSHCYERPPRPGWPYSVYAMIHGRSRAECRRVIRAIANDAGVTRYRELPTVKEFKKSRADYFNAAD